jgi:hypothetical protein
VSSGPRIHPAALLPDRGVTRRAEADDLIVAAWDVAPERPELRLRIAPDGGAGEASALRCGNAGRKEFGYIPCGSEVRAERRFGDVVVPSEVTVGWWLGTPEYEPFFTARIETCAALRRVSAARCARSLGCAR